LTNRPFYVLYLFVFALAPFPPIPSGPASPSDFLARTLGGLCRAIAARCAGRDAAITVARPLLILLWSRLNRTVLRFASLAARAAAGRLAAPRQRPARPASVSPPSPSPLSSPRPPAVEFAWLVRLVPGTAAYGSQLQYLLATPEMAALLATAPQAGRILRPLCRMLGVPPPPAPPARPQAAKPAPAKPEPAPATPTTSGAAAPEPPHHAEPHHATAASRPPPGLARFRPPRVFATG
jgi:hypothetical protein